MTNMMNGVVAINGGVGVMEIRQPLPQTVESVAQPVENLTVNAHISLRELKNTVAAVIEKKLPKYAQLIRSWHRRLTLTGSNQTFVLILIAK